MRTVLLSYGTIFSKNEPPCFIENREASWFEKWSCHMTLENSSFFPRTRNAVAYYVRLLQMLLAVHSCQWAVLSWDNCLLIAFHYQMTPFFWSMGPLFFERHRVICSRTLYWLFIFREILAELRSSVLCLTNIHRVAFNFSTSSSTSASFLAVFTLAYNELQTFITRYVFLYSRLCYIGYFIILTIFLWNLIFFFF